MNDEMRRKLIELYNLPLTSPLWKDRKPVVIDLTKRSSRMSKRTARFHIRRTRNGQYRPYLRAANGEQVVGSETYKTKQGAERWIRRLYIWVGDAALSGTIYDGDKSK